MKRYWLLFVLPFILVACNDPLQKVNQLKAEVMEIHDSSMVKMGAIYNQISSLKKIQATIAADSTNPDSILNTQVLDAITDLRSADDGMMDWMANYSEPSEEEDVAEAMAYLEAEKKNITEVDREIDKSLANGQALLDRVNQD